MPWVALAAAAITAGGAYAASKNATDSASQQYQNMFQNFMNVAIPDPRQQQIVLDRLVNQGELDPVLQQAIQQNPTAFNQVVENAQYLNAKNKALGDLQQISDQGGLRLQDRLALNQALQQSQTQATGQRQAISDQMARRGQTGSGLEVAAQLANVQNQANQDANTSLGVAANAQDRAFQAIQQAGQLGGQYSAQDFQQQAARAQAQDAINRFNTANTQSVMNANTAAQNYANEYNLSNQQRIADANVGIQNQQNMYNSQLGQQNFENQMARLAGASGQLQGMANTTLQAGQNTANTISNLGGAAVGAINTKNNQDFWSNYFNQKNGTTNSTPAASNPYEDPNYLNYRLGQNSSSMGGP